MHDIGEMSVPDTIVTSTSAVAPDEVPQLQQHCWYGYTFLQRIPFLGDEVAEIVYSHHEHYDGTGYPRGLAGEKIPLGARLISIAEAVDVITSGHSDQAVRTWDAALGEISSLAGKKFDPELVRILQQMPITLFQDLRAEINQPSS